MTGLARSPARQLAGFVLAGIFNTAFSYGIYALGLWLGLSYPVANFVSMIIGVLAGFVTQGHFVFRKLEARRFPFFVLFWLLMWGLNVLLIRLLLPLAGGNAYAAGALALIVIVPLSFLVQKYLVFGGGFRR